MRSTIRVLYLSMQVVAAVLFHSSGPVAFAQLPCLPSAAHGTVNVVLASPKGIAIATDSKLSSDGRARGVGPKLIKVDESTFVSIAGQYCDPGPDFGGHSYPVAQAQLVPAMITNYLRVAHFPSDTSIQEKAELLSRVVEFGLELTARLNLASHRPLSLMPTDVTVAGYERRVSKTALQSAREKEAPSWSIAWPA